MATGRPPKETADYFAHYIDGGANRAALFTIEEKFENDGYALWYKLQELLCATKGHAYDLDVPANLQYLAARAHVKEDLAVYILDALADIGAIDTDLWRADHVAWIQLLVNGMAELYSKRKTDMPQRPAIRHRRRGMFPSYNPVSDTGNGRTGQATKIENGMLQSYNPVSDTGKDTPTAKTNKAITQFPASESLKLNNIKLNKTIKGSEKESVSIVTQADAVGFVMKRVSNAFIEQVRHDFTDIDFDNELLKFALYWTDGRRNLARPKLALRNWMDKARTMRTEHRPARRDAKNLPDTKTLKEQWK